MCGLFGFVNYGRKDINGLNSLADKLAVASAARGTDATGIAYLEKDKIVIKKEPVSAYIFKMKFPQNTKVLMGHTRQTTQGSPKHNYNNHPFIGSAGKHTFALAHNGVLYNDGILKKEKRLPKTKIQTDSYIAVQLLEQFNSLSIHSIQKMAEAIEGMFTFTLLDDRNNLYIIKGDSPFIIAHFPALQLYVYASTEQILFEGLMKWPKTSDLVIDSFKNNKINMNLIELNEGDILQIKPTGHIEQYFFTIKEKYYPYLRNYRNNFVIIPRNTTTISEERVIQNTKLDGDEYWETLYYMANLYGYTEQEINNLLEWGVSLDEIEEALNDGTICDLFNEIDFMV